MIKLSNTFDITAPVLTQLWCVVDEQNNVILERPHTLYEPFKYHIYPSEGAAKAIARRLNASNRYPLKNFSVALMSAIDS